VHTAILSQQTNPIPTFFVTLLVLQRDFNMLSCCPRPREGGAG
jgi:hypothetical protein